MRRRLTLRDVAGRAGISFAMVHAVESGAAASLETYARLAAALGLRPEFALVDPRRRPGNGPRVADAVHAAMGELEAAHLRRLGFEVRVDEPYQHYQFAGRADVLAIDHERSALLHLENKTRITDVQDLAGTFSAKRAYLARVVAERIGLRRGLASETHVLVGLWSAEVIHQLRLRAETFRSLCPDPPGAFEAWWSGDAPAAGRISTMVLLDPAVPGGSRARLFAAGDTPGTVRPRHRDYADALATLRIAGRA